MNHTVYVSTSGLQAKNALQVRQLRMSKKSRGSISYNLDDWFILTFRTTLVLSLTVHDVKMIFRLQSTLCSNATSFDSVHYLLVNKSGWYWLDIWTAQVSPTKCPFINRLDSTF
jgi:hypothetical protein